MQRRQRRQLNQKVRIQSANNELNVLENAVQESPVSTPVANIAAPVVQEEVKLLPQATAQSDDEGSHDRNANNENGMPRRSRRSPRHLRVSGQRRRRYRDERYPTQSAMPYAGAFASPEMASGKVWVRYPVAQTVEPAFVANPVEQPLPVEVAAVETPVNIPAVIVAAPVAAAAPVAIVTETVAPAPASQHKPGGSSPAAAVPGRAPVVAPVVVEPVAVEPAAVEPTAVELASEVAQVEAASEVEETAIVDAGVAETIAEPVVQEAIIEEAIAEDTRGGRNHCC